MIPRRKYDIEANLRNTILSSLISGRLVEGEEIAEFEDKFSLMLSSKSKNELFATATSSGREALFRVLNGLRVPSDLKILVPSYTLGALVPFLKSKDFKCKVCDVGREYPVMDAETIEKELKTDVSCILLTHLFGYVAEIEDILSLAKSKDVLVIEDCAHSVGSGYYDYSTGTFGDGALFSFDALKPINTFGGGMAVTKHESVYKTILQTESAELKPKSLKLFKQIATTITEQVALTTSVLKLPTGLLAFEQTKPIMDILDKKFRRPSSPVVYRKYSNFQAQIGLKQLKSLDQKVKRKRFIAGKILDALDLYDEQLNGKSYKQSNAYFLVLKAAENENVRHLRKELWIDGIDAGIGNEIADNLGTIVGSEYKNASDWYNRAIQLPCYSSMSDETLAELLSKIEKYKGRLVRV